LQHSQTTVSGQATAPEGGCDIEIIVCRVVRQPDEAFSTHTTLRKCGPTFQIGCRRRDAARTRGRQVHSRRLREVEITRRVPNIAGSRIQPSVPRYDATVRYFLHWPSRTLSWTKSHTDLCWYPLQPTRTNGRCILWLQKTCGRRGTGDPMTPTTSVAIFEPVPAGSS
jgi:hypothetical protein